MSREFSDALLEEYFSTNPTSTDLVLARVSDGTSDYFFVRDYNDLTYEAQVYTALPFDITLPNDKETEESGATLKIADPNGELFTLVRTADTLTAEFEIVNVAQGGAVTSVSSFPHFTLSTVRWDTATVTFNLARDDSTMYAFPKDKMDNITFPGMY